MRRFMGLLFAVAVFGSGYALGTSGLLAPRELQAQLGQDEELTEATQKKIVLANSALKDAMRGLMEAKRYDSATNGVNAFLVLCGGANALADLEAGRGVDPETFAALHAGQAIPEVADYLGYDDDGRLTYKNRVVQLYPKKRLQQMWAERLKLAGDE